MIECIFTIDYEIYGNGTGALADLVLDPAARLADLFETWNARFVTFVEAIEFEKIEMYGADTAIDAVKRQIRNFHERGFEIGLHLHPQWANAHYSQGSWTLDHTEYNLCVLSESRIAEIIDGSVSYLRHVVNQNGFIPLSYRAGNWLFQPTRTAAAVLYDRGFRIDSSVFKGGRQRNYGLDYRRAIGNGYFWTFKDNVAESDPAGKLVEVPIYAEQVPTRRLLTVKRVSLGNNFGASQTVKQKVNRALDFLRWRYPLKFDFCRMTIDELTSMMDRLIREDRIRPDVYRPIVAIGHTKDLSDFGTVESFLSFLKNAGILVTTFEAAWSKLNDFAPAGSIR